MTNFGKISGYLISFLFGLPTGFLLYAYSTNYLNFAVAREITFQIDPWGIVSLLISVVLAGTVLRQLNKKDEGEKSERGMLINYFTTFDAEFSQKIREVAKDDTRLDAVTNVLKRYGVRLEKITHLAVQQGYLKKDSVVAKSLVQNVKNVRDLLTDTPPKGATVDDGIKVVNNKLMFSVKQIDKIAYAIYDINCTIFLLVVEINNSPHK